MALALSPLTHIPLRDEQGIAPTTTEGGAAPYMEFGFLDDGFNWNAWNNDNATLFQSLQSMGDGGDEE